MADPDEPGPLRHAGPDTPRAGHGRRPRDWSERVAECLCLWSIASPLVYWGYCCWTRAAGLVPGFGERDDLNRNGWAFIAAGGTVVCLGLWSFRRRTR